MAPPFLLLLLLVASGEEPPTATTGLGLGCHTSSFASSKTRAPRTGHASDAPPQGQGLMDYLKFTHGCGSFAALLATTANATEIFREHVDGLMVFCLNDLAAAAFEPQFNSLSADHQLAVVLCHGAAARYTREQVESVAVLCQHCRKMPPPRCSFCP